MTESEIDALARRIRRAIDCGPDLAHDYAVAMGDSPEIVGGQIVVRNESGRIVVRVPMTVLEACDAGR